jgi:ABC-type multidrug transport system fused ATPase/permease subunit
VRRLAQAARTVSGLVRQAAPRAAVALLACQALAGFATLATLLATSRVLAALVDPGGTPERLLRAAPWLGACAGAFVARVLIDAIVARARARLAPRVHRVAQARLVEASLHVELAAFDDPGFYDQLHRARDRGVPHLEGATEQLVDALGAVVNVAGAALALAWLDPLLLPVLLVALLPEAAGALAVARLHLDSMSTSVALYRQVELMTELATDRDAAPEIRSHQAEAYVHAEHARSADAMQAHVERLGRAQAAARLRGHLASACGQAATLGLLGFLLWTDRLPLAAAGTTLIALRGATAALERLVQVGGELFEKALYIADYDDFVAQSRVRRPRPDGLPAPAQPAAIELDGVGFHYAGRRDTPALQDVTLRLRAGETIALVGENGSGKTTLAKLLAGLYAPTAGSIRWDGLDTRRMSPRSLADRVAMVLQHPVRWPRSARANVRVGRHDRDDPGDQVLARAARDARAQEVVDRLPRGWDTVLSRYFRGGVDLSGGQWQRLAVARGLYRDAPLVIWDEPTAPLDAKAERAVYESLRRLAQGRTVVLITHRLASVRDVDRIVFLERGRVVEQGRHEALLALGGRYAELWRLQARLNGLEVDADEHVADPQDSIPSPGI